MLSHAKSIMWISDSYGIVWLKVTMLPNGKELLQSQSSGGFFPYFAGYLAWSWVLSFHLYDVLRCLFPLNSIFWHHKNVIINLLWIWKVVFLEFVFGCWAANSISDMVLWCKYSCFCKLVWYIWGLSPCKWI